MKLDLLYRHFRGEYYRLLYRARDSETLEDVVVYENAHHPDFVWVRPAAMFFEKLPDGRQRFEPVDNIPIVDD